MTDCVLYMHWTKKLVKTNVERVSYVDVVTQRSADDATKKLGNELNHSSSVDFIKGLQQLQKVSF